MREKTDLNVISEAELVHFIEHGYPKDKSHREVEYFIRGFKVSHVIPFVEVEIKGVSLPLYKKRDMSDVVYSAGYYYVNYDDNKWKLKDNVFYDVLKSHEYIGPFHDKKTARRALFDKRTNYRYSEQQ